MSNPDRALVFKAGRSAYAEIREHGFAAEQIGTILGASGGAKWLVLSQLDRVITDRILPKLEGPVYLLGSSVGAWRFACYAQPDPRAAIERFEAAYLAQRYSEKPDAKEITSTTVRILDTILGPNGAEDALAHPILRTNVMTVRARHLTASERRPVLAAGLLMAMAANTVHRRTLGAFFERGLFYDARDLPPFYDITGFPIHRIPLTVDNFRDAVVATGSIPLVLEGVRDIAGAPPGMYRDGGIIDYHLDLPAAAADRIALFPHFFDELKPGWFDKRLGWRRHAAASTDRMLVICPSNAFIAGLPGGKVPDRHDFLRLTEADRVRIWTGVVDACRRLADELHDALDRNDVPASLEPL